jgi:hypothetical protein
MYQQLKFFPISNLKSSYISLGGEMTCRYSYYKNEDWGDAPPDNNRFVLKRLLLHAGFHLGKELRGFIQLQSSTAAGLKRDLQPIEEDQLDVHQALIEVQLFQNLSKQLAIRTGCQEFLYGSQRLITVREGPNVKASFDAAKLFFRQKHIAIDAFWGYPVANQKEVFDNKANRSGMLGGCTLY